VNKVVTQLLRRVGFERPDLLIARLTLYPLLYRTTFGTWWAVQNGSTDQDAFWGLTHVGPTLPRW